MSAVYRPGHRYAGREGDVLFAVLTENGPEFVTTRGTRVPIEKAERVYAPLTPLDTVPAEAVRDLVSATRDALNLPYPAGDWEPYDRLIGKRAAHLVGILDGFLNPVYPGDPDPAGTARTIRTYAGLEPVTYPTRDSQDGGAK